MSIVQRRKVPNVLPDPSSSARFLILDNVTKSTSVLCDTYGYTNAFPNLNAVYYEDNRPSGMPLPFYNADYGERYSYANGTTLAVFQPTSRKTITDLVLSLRPRRTVRKRMTDAWNQVKGNDTVVQSAPLIAHIRLRFEGILVEDEKERLLSGLKPLVDHRALVVDLGDEPLPQLTDGALGPYFGMGDTEPHDGAWKIDMISHSANIPDLMVSVSR